MNAPASPVKFTENGAGYAVTRRADGAALGTVTKGSTYYNLHPRPATYIHWTATDAHGQTVKDSDGRSRKFSTRTDAAAHLVNLYETAERIMRERAAELDALPTDDEETDLGRVYPSADETGFVALPVIHECETCPSVGSTLCDEDGVSIVYPTRGDAARAILAHLQEVDEDEPADVVDDLCGECGEPRDLGDDGELLPCATCAEAVRPVHLMSADLLPACGSKGDATGVSVAPWTTPERITCRPCRALIDPTREADLSAQERETARIEGLCQVAYRAHEAYMATHGRGKGKALDERVEALDALRVAALPEDATNFDALDLALGGTTVEAIERRLASVRASHLASA